MKLTTSLIIVAAIGGLFIAGCSKVQQDAPQTTPVADDHGHDKAEDDHAEHEHNEWWCNEHGVPEEECTRCDSSLVATFKKKEDWCDKHDRPASQCFICTPANAEIFAARYEAKYGKQPPKPEEEGSGEKENEK